jgi:carbonic anhydrase
MQSYERLLLENKAWALEQKVKDPEFFKRLENQQAPEFLWIGCSDSRVPPNQITNTQPGEMFIHRNIANLVVNTDINLLSVLQYAVEVLKVKHVIVCGHYGCGGVKAAMTQKGYGIIDNWLKEIKDVYRINKEELDEVNDDEVKFDKMVEMNVREQVFNLAKTTIIQKAWKMEQRPQLHGWVYRLSDGIIKPVCEMDANSAIDPLYEYDNL